jgi:hypothetical protein
MLSRYTLFYWLFGIIKCILPFNNQKICINSPTTTDGDKYYRKWSSARRNVSIDFYPKDSLEIQTYSTFTPVPGGKDYIKVGFYNSENSLVGSVSIDFYENSKSYVVSFSQDYTQFPVEPPSSVDKIWRITVMKDKIIIHCNGKEVLNIYSSYSRTYSFGRWKIDEITQLKFSSEDRASNYYRFFNSK